MPYDPIAEKERVCKMLGRSRLECFGCPVLECAFNEQPFSSLEATLETVLNAAEMLRTNRVWLLDEAGKSVSGREVYESLGESPEGELLARLVENRQEFIRNLAVEGTTAGVLSEVAGAELARMRRHGDDANSPNTFSAFLARVARRQELLEEPEPLPGEQHHTKSIHGYYSIIEGNTDVFHSESKNLEVAKEAGADAEGDE